MDPFGDIIYSVQKSIKNFAGGGGGETPVGGSVAVTAPVERQLPSGRFALIDPLTGEVISSYWPQDGGGGGGAAAVDHFFDVNPLDQAQFDHRVAMDEFQKQMDLIANQRADAQMQMDRIKAERDWALDQGNFALAQQKQADFNHWQGIEAGFRQQELNLQNQGQQLDYAVGMANVEVAKQRAANEYQIGMANATNDAERNMVEDRWHQQQALIAQMEDATRRHLGGLEAQTNQFQAETDRAARMGDLGLRTNQFIADLARSPRDLFSLFMMQRGVTPDWDTMAAGGTPAVGDPLRVVDPLKAFIPTTAAPTNFMLPRENLQMVTGNVAKGAAGNPFITAQAPGGGGGGGVSVPPVSFLPFNTDPIKMPEQRQILFDRNAGMQFADQKNGVPLANMQRGLNLSTVSGDVRGSDFDLPAYYDEGMTMPVGKDDVISNGSKVYIYYNPDSLPKAAAGGLYTGPAVVGDDPEGRDRSREEIVTPALAEDGRPAVHVQPANPEGLRAQQRVNTMGWNMNRPNRWRDWGNLYQSWMQRAHQAAANRPAAEQVPNMGRLDFWRDIARHGQQPGFQMQAEMAPTTPLQLSAPGAASPRLEAGYDDWFTPPSSSPRQDADVDDVAAGRHRDAFEDAQNPDGNRGARLDHLRNMADRLAHFALGTESAQADYDRLGLRSLWMPKSANPGVDVSALPTRLRMLYDQGIPLSPSVVAGATGGIAPTLNLGYAATVGRGVGVLPSLQTLGRQSKSETEATRGYLEGVGGMPWGDLVDYLASATRNLRSAAVAQGV